MQVVDAQVPRVRYDDQPVDARVPLVRYDDQPVDGQVHWDDQTVDARCLQQIQKIHFMIYDLSNIQIR